MTTTISPACLLLDALTAAGRIEKLSGSILKELTGAATVAAAMDAIRNDMTGREDFAEICFSYREACAIARARKERSE